MVVQWFCITSRVILMKCKLSKGCQLLLGTWPHQVLVCFVGLRKVGKRDPRRTLPHHENASSRCKLYLETLIKLLTLLHYSSDLATPSCKYFLSLWRRIKEVGVWSVAPVLYTLVQEDNTVCGVSINIAV